MKLVLGEPIPHTETLPDGRTETIDWNMCPVCGIRNIEPDYNDETCSTDSHFENWKCLRCLAKWTYVYSPSHCLVDDFGTS